jgi:hypothetical protein
MLVPAAAQPTLIPATTTQVALNAGIFPISTAIVGRPGASIYVTTISLVPIAGSVVTISAGNGVNCATGQTTLVGPLTFTNESPFVVGSGYGAVLVVPQGKDLCLTIATAVAPGWIAYGIF